MKDLAQRAKDKKLKPEEFQGGTFSISNLGMFGIKAFASIINEPQGAIMSVGAGEQRPVVVNGQLAVATVMTVTLTCDHRVVDGGVSIEGGGAWLADGSGVAHFLFTDGPAARAALEAAGIRVVAEREVLVQRLRQDVPRPPGHLTPPIAHAPGH